MPDRATAQQAVAAPITAPVPRAARGPRGLVLAGLVAALGLLLALCAWLLATELDQVRAHAQIDHLAHARAAQAQAEIDAAARLARYAGSSELAAPDARGAAAARRMLELDPALRAVTVLDTSGRPLWQEGAQDTHSLQQALAVWPHVLAAQRPLAAVFIAPRRPGPAGEARLLVLVRQAAGHPPVLFAFDALRLFGASLQAGRAGVNFDLADANGLALLGGAGSADAEHIASVPLGSPYGNWQLRVSATPSAQAGLHSDAPQWLAASTLLLYALLVAGAYELRARRLRRVRLERRDRLLRAQVAQRRHSERRLEDRERLLAALIARFPGGLILIDPEQQVAACNEAYKRMLDLPPELFAEVPLAAERIVHFLAQRGEFGEGDPEYLAAWWLDPERLAQTEHRRPDGTVLGLNCHRLADGSAIGILSDLSATRSTQQELDQLREQFEARLSERSAGLLRAKESAERANRGKSEFLATMAHELRTPIHSIVAFARKGREKAAHGASGKCRDFFERIISAGDRQLHLINNLLDLARLESGKQALEPCAVDLHAICREVLNECEALLEAKQLRAELQAPDCDTVIEADPVRCAQVVRNIVSNAIKFSPAGKTLGLQFADSDLPAGRRAADVGRVPALALQVQDEGPGIPEGEIEAIFGRFVQSSRTERAGGSGLGLAICREIVHAHRGRISARNRAGGGAEFEVVLPRP